MSEAKTKPPKHEALTRAEERALNNLETQGAGGRDILLEKLLHVADLSPDEERLIAALTDPEKARYGLAALCADSGFSVARFLKFLTRADGARALVGAITHVHAKGESVARDAMELGTIREFKCGPCDGDGVVLDKNSPKDKPQMIKCGICLGAGKIIKEPTPAQQKIALQLMGMLSQGAGMSLTVNANSSANAESKSVQQTALVDNKFMDSLRANTDAAIARSRGLKPGTMTALPEPDVVDAEVMLNEKAPAQEVDAAARVPAPVATAGAQDVIAEALRSAASRDVSPVPAARPGVVIPPLGLPGGVRRPPPAVT